MFFFCVFFFTNKDLNCVYRVQKDGRFRIKVWECQGGGKGEEGTHTGRLAEKGGTIGAAVVPASTPGCSSQPWQCRLEEAIHWMRMSTRDSLWAVMMLRGRSCWTMAG